jgi:hypothetical protein
MMIHLKSRWGTFTLTGYDRKKIFLKTKHEKFSVPHTDFLRFAEGNINAHVTEKAVNAFMEIVGESNRIAFIEELNKANLALCKTSLDMEQFDLLMDMKIADLYILSNGLGMITGTKPTPYPKKK